MVFQFLFNVSKLMLHSPSQWRETPGHAQTSQTTGPHTSNCPLRGCPLDRASSSENFYFHGPKKRHNQALVPHWLSLFFQSRISPTPQRNSPKMGAAGTSVSVFPALKLGREVPEEWAGRRLHWPSEDSPLQAQTRFPSCPWASPSVC